MPQQLVAKRKIPFTRIRTAQISTLELQIIGGRFKGRSIAHVHFMEPRSRKN